MKHVESYFSSRAALLALIVIAAIGMPGRAAERRQVQYTQQPKEQAGQKPQVSNDEMQEAKKVDGAADAAGRLRAAADFVKKYPKSTLMDTIAKLVASKISETQDPNQVTSLCEQFLTIFKNTPQAKLIYSVEIDAYNKANKPDDALRVELKELDEDLAGLATQPNSDDLPLLTRVVSLAMELVKHNNGKYVGAIQQYGARAISLIEADKKPADLSDSQWADYKTRVLPQIYQSLGLVALMLQKDEDARLKLEKAVELNPSDAFSYYLLGTIADNEYQETYKKYKGMLPGAEQQATLKKALEQMDKTIDLFAHAVALSEGNQQTQALHDKALQDLQVYYNYRHKDKGSAGMQELINKYKKPASSSGA